MIDESERILKEAAVAYSRYYPEIFAYKYRENHGKPQSQQPVSRPRFEPTTFRIQI
jgi:hypothetical protein